ncbi:hypothetical protein E2C01_051683 [Portunus trituberculatus]|uniref:Uncharacterized protein n=1 Tax=Portunus trituberculatus TaxID=210409 RepID=A0A5B7GJE4_PORTR|nr:hypothetical protein [Portunus trituberculatus]
MSGCCECGDDKWCRTPHIVARGGTNTTHITTLCARREEVGLAWRGVEECCWGACPGGGGAGVLILGSGVLGDSWETAVVIKKIYGGVERESRRRH